ncbi:DUF6702 family protein [Neolewinella antarctica]|uniref:Uncharacterized protein n=1 Tax=Neolewinella antarctica TaxID=442734 RepID=A0ABX0XBF8_9BACT|nr:DUF6702 family protein [Neolewinella antarctica]NJC26590.1 hypothetical protein [Neolewinella antarctica]
MYLISLLLFLSNLAPATAPLPVHEYHISKTNVRYVAEREQVQIEMHLFVEDLEKDMVTLGAPGNLELGTEIQHADAERLLTNYLANHFRLNWNGEPLPLAVIGYELEDDLHGFWVYLAATDVAAPTTIDVTATLLTETFADQKNIVKIYNGEKRGATLLMSKQRTTGSYGQ